MKIGRIINIYFIMAVSSLKTFLINFGSFNNLLKFFGRTTYEALDYATEINYRKVNASIKSNATALFVTS